MLLSNPNIEVEIARLGTRVSWVSVCWYLDWDNDLNTPVSETLSGYSAGLHVDRPGSRGVQNPGSRSVYPPDLYPPAWSGPVYPPSTLYPLAGSRSVTGYIKPQKDGTTSVQLKISNG